MATEVFGVDENRLNFNVRCGHCLVWIEFPCKTDIEDSKVTGERHYRIECPGCGRNLLMLIGDKPKAQSSWYEDE